MCQKHAVPNRKLIRWWAGLNKQGMRAKCLHKNQIPIVMSKANNKIKVATRQLTFLLSPTGKFNLGYSAGDTAFVEEKQAAELVEAGYAEYTRDDENDSAELSPAEVLANENAALKEINASHLAEIARLKTAAKENGLPGNLPIGATNGTLTNTISSIDEAVKAVDTFDTLATTLNADGRQGVVENAPVTADITPVTDAAGDTTGTNVTKAGETTTVTGENGAPDIKITKGGTK